MRRASEGEQPLQNQRILVVEDEFVIAVAIEAALSEAGADVVRVRDVPDAVQNCADQTLSAALLDVRLGRQTTEAVADMLVSRNIPFIFYSGHGLPEEMRSKHPQASVLLKPIPPNLLISAMVELIHRRSV